MIFEKVNFTSSSGVTFDDVPTDGSTNAVRSNGIYDALVLKADLDSPALTGTPTAPTASSGTNTTQIATTAFVQSAVSGGGMTIDSAMSDSSENAVQNKVIKAYVDAQSGGGGSITIDTAMSDNSTNAVRNNVIKAYVDTGLSSKQNTLTFDSTPTASSTNPVTSGGVYTALHDLTPVTMGTVSLTTSWTNEGDGIYSQSVNITGATANSKIDLQPDSTVLAQMITDKCFALGAVNNAGVITVYAYGNAPTVALTVQFTRTEVAS